MKYRLGDLCSIVSGSTPKTNVPEYWGGNLKWVTPAELSDDSYIVNDTVRKITELGVSKTALNSFPAGTVLLSSRAPIGKVAIAGCDMYCNQGFKNLICSSKIYNKYLFWFLKSKTDFLNSLGRGATFKEISKQIVSDIEIELPDFDNQVKLSNIFEKISLLISLRTQQLEQLDLLIKSRFVEMFGDPVINNKNFPIVTIGDICFVTKLAGFEYTDYIKYQNSGDVIMIRGLNVKDKHLKLDDIYWIDASVSDSLPRSQLKENDIVMTYVGVNIGDVALVDNKHRYHLAPNVAKISPYNYDKMNPIFFVNLLALNKENFASNATNTAKQALNMDKIRQLIVMVPPLTLQNQFAEFVQQVDKSKFAIKKSLEQLETLKKKLMQDYFG